MPGRTAQSETLARCALRPFLAVGPGHHPVDEGVTAVVLADFAEGEWHLRRQAALQETVAPAPAPVPTNPNVVVAPALTWPL